MGHDLVQRLVDAVYEAALRPDTGWDELARELSEAFRGPVLISLLPPGSPGLEQHPVGLVDGFAETHPELLVSGLPYSSTMSAHFTESWASMGDLFPGLDLKKTEYYTEWMKPQKLAPVWPIGCTVTANGLAGLGVAVFRLRGGKPFTDDELDLGDELFPHLCRAWAFHNTLSGVQRERLALAEVVDRLPIGVILLDAKRKAVISNRSADRIVALDDGFRIGPNGPYAESARDNAALQKMIADALDAEAGSEFASTGIMAISRPSHRRDFPVMVTPLLSALPCSAARDAVVVMFISDVEASQVDSTSEVLETLYSLTHSEAELVRLLSEGHSLDEAAELRGVTMNTARSHLKHVFAKTGTNRQGELVRLVLTGVAALREP